MIVGMMTFAYKKPSQNKFFAAKLPKIKSNACMRTIVVNEIIIVLVWPRLLKLLIKIPQQASKEYKMDRKGLIIRL